MWGHTGGSGQRLILKCDGESSMKAFRDTLGRFHGGVVIPESPAKGESQSNGRAEGAGRVVREFTRVLKEQIELKAETKIESSAEILQWMVRWAAMISSRYFVGKDGRTAYEGLRGRTCISVVVPFGGKV